MTQILRWLLIPPAAIAAWYVALMVGIALVGGLYSLCPTTQVVSGMCVVPWYRAATEGLVCFGAGLAAVLVLLTCTLLAPKYKPRVAIVTFVVGAVIAACMGLSLRTYGALAAAIGAGALTLWVLLRRARGKAGVFPTFPA